MQLDWMAAALRALAVPVIEEPGWRTRGHDGSFDPTYIVWHHDASAKGPSPGALEWVIKGDKDLPGPCAHVWVCVGCNGAHLSGTWHLTASGLAYHAGIGGPYNDVPADTMNHHAIGIETDHTVGEAWDRMQLASLRLGTGALLNHLGRKPDPSLLFHKTWTDVTARTRGRKVDPDGLDLTTERISAGLAAAAAARAKPLPTPPTIADPLEESMFLARFAGTNGDGTNPVYLIRGPDKVHVKDMADLQQLLAAGIPDKGNRPGAFLAYWPTSAH